MDYRLRRNILGADLAAVLLLVACGSRTDPLDEYGQTGGGGGTVDCSACPTDEFSGDLILDSQAQVDSLPQYGSVTGQIMVSEGANVVDLDSLQCISAVGKSVDLQGAQLQSVSGLACLSSVNGLFRIKGATALTNVDGLERLTEVGVDLTLSTLDSLADVDGLKGVRSVGRNLNVVNVPNLPTCDAVGLGDQLVDLGGAVVIKGTLPDECGP
jgi:hypothetical protein